jgi:hypothetical protein
MNFFLHKSSLAVAKQMLQYNYTSINIETLRIELQLIFMMEMRVALYA